MNRLSIATILFACMTSSLAYAANWQPLTRAETLQNLVSGATAEIELTPGVTAVGTYHADGTAEIEAWNETFRRAWSVKGDDQVCYSDVETNCFSFEQNLDDPAQYRASNVETGEVFIFRIPDASSADAMRMLFQPSLPYKLTDTTNLFVRPWGVLGALVSHQWDVAGEDDYDTSITGGQYFYAFNLNDGWQINASPTFSYNHEASSGNEWTLPLGIGTSKTTFIG